MKSDFTFQNRTLAWFLGLVLILATNNLAQAQIPACAPGSGNTLSGPVGPPLTAGLNAGCNAVIPNVLPRWTAAANVPGGWVLITVEQAPLAGTLIDLPRSSSCPGDVIDINVVAVFFYLGVLTDPSDDILCSITDIDEFTIVDGTPPTITPGDVTLQAGPGCTVTAADIIATITNAEVNDNCTDDATLRANVVITAGLPAVLTCPTNNDVFPITVTTEDACGNISAPATFNVTLEDTRRPIPTCPADQTRYFNAFCQYTVEDFRPLVTAVDDCGAPFTLSQRVIAPVPFPNNTFPIITGGGCPSLRTVIVRICAQDCFGNGNLNPPLTSSPPNCCTFAVAVYDNTDPTPEPGDCPAPVLLTTDANCEVIIPDFRTSGLFSDNCDPLLDPTTITQTPPPGPFDASAVVCPPLASLDVSFSFTDCNGNGPVELVCPDVIQIQDLLAPSSITCPTPMDTFNLAIDPVTCQYTFATVPADWFDDRAVATDNCDSDPIEHNALATFDCTELGIQPIPVWAEDCSGNVSGILANCDVFIRANPADAGWDNPGPVCMTDLPLDLCTYITGVTCGEWSGDQLTAGRCSAGGGIFNPPAPGSYAVTYTVGDADCHVELTRVIQVEQSFSAPFLINDFGICWCPDELLDLESLLLGSAPEGGVWTISNSPGLAFALLPPAGPGNSHLARYDAGCGVSTITYFYNDCSGNTISDQIAITIRRCPVLDFDVPTNMCQDDAPYSINIFNRTHLGCADYLVTYTAVGPDGAAIIGGPVIGPLLGYPSVTINPLVTAGSYTIIATLADPLGICLPVIREEVVRIYQAVSPSSTANGIMNPGILCETDTWPLTLDLINLNDLAGDPLTADNVRWFGGGVTDNGISGLFTPNDSDGDGFPGPGSYTVCVSVGDQRCEQIYCITIVIENHVPGSCTLQSYAACLEPGATISFADLLESDAPMGGKFTVVGILGDIVEEFEHTGAMQTWVVPDGVTQINIEAWGAQGGDGSWGGFCGTGGLGGYASGTMNVTPGQVLNIFVGGQGGSNNTNLFFTNPGGFNGGGAGGFDAASQIANGGGGGGASDIRIGGTGLANRALVAGGGGGASCNSSGGNGGGFLGDPGGSFINSIGGGGGSQIAGGLAGLLGRGATHGALGLGGLGGTNVQAHGCGGGGGGYYGGGGGTSTANHGSGWGASAGGGSSYVGGVASGSTTPGVQSGNGLVRITANNPAFNVVVGDMVTGVVYNGGCGSILYEYRVESCPDDIVCRGQIDINQKPHVDLTGPQTFCAIDVVNYTLRNNGDAIICGEYGIWSGPGVTDHGNGLTADFNPAAAGEGVHYAVYTIGNTEPINCQVIDTLEIVVYAASDPSFTIPQNTCEDVSEVILVLDNSDPSVDEGSPDGDSEVYWSGPGVTDYTGDNAGGNFDPSAAGPGYHLICVMTGEGPCMKFACRLIHVHEARNASLVADLARGCYDFQPSGGGPFVDFNLDELLTPTTTPGGTWTQLSGTPITIRNTAASVAPGCHELQYTVPAAYAGAVGDCAEMSDIVYLLIVEEPKPEFDMAEEACWDGVDGSLSLPMDYTGETFGNAATRTYSWTASLISGAGPVPTFDINTLQNPIITIHGAGVFEICLTETLTYGACGATDAGVSCSQTYCERITIHETNVEVDPSWTRPVPYRFCTTDDCIDLDALVTGTPGGVFTGTGVSVEGSHPNYQFCPEDATPGTHVITYTVQNGAGCTAVMSHNVEVYAPVNAFCLENQFALACGTRRLGTSQVYGGFPNASAFYIPVYIESYYTMGTFDLETFLCPGATRGGTWNLISWPANALGGGLTGVVQSNTLVFTDPGCYVVEYRVEAWPGASDGCIDIYNYRLTVGEEPSPKFSMPNEICWAPGVPTISYNILANYLESLPPHPETNLYLRAFSSSNPAVATVTSYTGIVTIVGAGTATICMHEHYDNISCTFVECRKDYCQTITVTNTTTATSAEWTGFGPICVDADCVDLDDLVTGTPGGVFSGEGVEVEGSHPDYQFCPEEAGPGTHAVTYTVNSPDGCTNVLTRNIVVAPLANAELVNKRIECIVEPGGVVPLSVLFAGNSTTPGGTWSFAGTPPPGAVIMGGNLLFTRAGCYCFTYTVSTIPNATGGGCYAQGSACLQISEQPTPNFNMQNEICWSANDPETTFVPHLNSVYYDVPAEREWWLFPVPILSGITIDPVSGVVTVTDPTIPAGGLHFLVCLTETLVTPECGPAPGPNPATPALGEFRCEQGFCQRIVIRDGTLLDASFTISPVNPCLGEEVTLIPNTPGGTFTGNGVTDDGNGDDGTFVANECGIYAVTYVLDDPNGCNNSYTLNIYTDTVAPEINVPGDFTVDCQSPLIPSMDAWASGADAFDNCGSVSITYRIFDRRSGCSPGTGTYVFEFTATDECGNTAVDYANYVVRDITPPVISRGGNLSVECGSDVYARVYQWINTNGGAIATDACDGSPYLIWSNNWSGLINNYCGGQIPVTFTVTDRCGNSASVTFTLEVLDRTAPVWNIPPQNVVFECDNSSDPYSQVSGWLRSNGNGIALDSCFTSVNYTNNFNGLSGGCNRNTGSALVTFTAYDVCGNSSTRQATVSVVDRTPPEITSPAKDTVVECDGQGNTREFAVWIANHGGARAIDLCSGVSCGPIPGARAAFVTGTSLPWGGGPLYDDYTTSMNQVFGAGNWDQFNFGAPAATIFSQNFRFIYLDGGDNSADEFNSFVNANRSLIESWVACGGRLFLNAAPNEGGNIDLGFGGVQILYTPNFPPSGTIINAVTASGAILSGPYQPTGTNFTGTYFAHAIVGPPTMTVMIRETGGANRPVFAQSLWGSGVVMFGGMTPSGWHAPQPNARNLKWNILDRLNSIPLQNDINHLTDGIFVWDTTLMRTEVTCGQNRILTYMFNALDSCGNISNATIAKFIVRDTTPPVWINEPRNLVVECDGLGNVDELNRWLDANGNGVILEDPCNGTVTYEHDLVREYDRCSNTDSVIYRFTARDCSGNTSTREASFIIRDTRPPTIVSPARDTTLDCANLSGNNDDELISWLNQRAGFNTTDECSDIINYSNNYDVNNWVLGCGNTKYIDVIFIATDDCGNVTRDIARFAIVDTEPPAFLNCPPPIVQNAEKDHCDAYVTVPKLVATDNCTQSDSITITQIYGPNPTQYRFPVGTTILKYEAVDLCGNRDTCTIKVVVNDYWDVPVITCPADLDLENTPGVCGTNNVRDIGPTSVTDVCPHTAVLYAITNEAGDTIKKGINDASGSNFPKGLNKVCYTVQDQPILLITEVTQQLGGAVIGPSTSMPSFSLADVNGDYLEITNFGPSSIDVSCLSIQIFEGGALLGTYTLPNMPGPVLPAGGVLTLKVGSAVVGYPNNPALFFYNMNLPEAAINTPRGYVLNHLGLRNLDAVTTNGYNLTGQGTPAMTAAGWSGISPTNTNRASYYRWCIFDRNIADDWRLAEACDPASIGRMNPILQQYVFPSNGLRTSVQTIAAQKDTCCFNVLVRDVEIPMCATNDTLRPTGSTNTFNGPGCYSVSLSVPANPATKIIDVWVTNLNISATNFANTEATLIAPDGTRVRLWNDGNCNGSTSLVSTRISDLDLVKLSGANCANLASGNNYLPDQPLAVLCPKSAAGVWRLEVENNASAPSSVTVNSWGLTIISQRAYAQGDTTFNNDPGQCGANFMWIHPTVMDNCCMGTVDVEYIPVPTPGCPLHAVPRGGRVDGGTKTTQFFAVGTTRVVYTLTDMSGNTGSCEFSVTIIDAEDPVFTNCPKDYTINLPGGDCFAFLEINPALWADDNCDSVLIEVNPPLNTELGIGSHKIVATATDKAGNSTMCMWTITVVESTPSGNDLSCVDLINFSLGPDCRGVITADELLAGTDYGCKDKYTIKVEDWITGQTHNNVFTTADIGRCFKVTVIDPVTGNSCWSMVCVEYKATPQIDCPDDLTITCNSSLDPSVLGYPSITSCVINYDVHWDDTIQKARDCDTPYAFIIHRTFTVVNELGNSSSCKQVIWVKAFDLNEIEWPRNYDNLDLPALNCDEKIYDKDVTPHILPSPYCVDGYLLDSAYWFATGGDPTIVDPFARDLSGDRLPMTLGWNCLDAGINEGHPSPYPVYYAQHPNWVPSRSCWGPNQVVMWHGTGAPSLNGIPISVDNKNCNLSIRYDDEVYDICENGYEILRYWKVRNMCLPPKAGVNPVEWIQVIKVLDQEGPKVLYPDTVIVGTGPWTCTGTWEVPRPWITDNCADSVRYSVRTWTGSAIQQADGSWIIINMKLGVHPVVITAEDACGNKTEKVVKVNVIDNTPPTAVCDRNIVVSISGNQSPGENFGKIFAEDINDGSFDNCQPHIFFKAIRMEHLRGTNNGSNAAQPDDGTNCAGANGDDNAVLDGNQIYFDDHIKFCCSDVNQRIMVVMRVFDADPGSGPISPTRMNQNGNLFGKFSDCMIEVEVQDKGVPTVVAPPNIVVSCWFWFDVDKLTDPNDPTFGRVVTDLSDRHKVVTTDLVCHNYCVRNDITGYPGYVPGAPPSNPPAWNRACDYYWQLFDTAHADRKYELTWGFDGYVLSNCGNTPTISVNDNRECGQGQLTRTVVARGPNNISITQTQTIWVVDCDPFYINRADNCDPDDDITWPGNCTGQATTIAGCGADLSPDNPSLGRPVVENGADDLCALISIEYVDEVFTIEPDACFKVLRHWTVIDWCQYDPNLDPNRGRWEYLQIIKVTDKIKPVVSINIGDCEPAVKTNGVCYGHLSITATATDDCSPLDWLFYEYKIDAFNDGQGKYPGFDFIVGPLTQKEYAAGRTPQFNDNPLADFPGNPFDASGTYPVGVHKICWHVEDGCGNVGINCQLFEIKDCKAPTPYCLTGVITVPMPTSKCVTIWAKDLDRGSFDNCTEQDDLLFYFNGDPSQTGITICCDDFVAAGANDELVVDVEMWVEDEEGNTDYCKTVVIVQDNQDVCPNTSPDLGRITGDLRTEKGDETELANVQMYVGAQMMREVVTRTDGQFLFGDLATGASNEYLIRPLRNDNHINGVSTGDIVKIQRHILGIEYLNTPYKLIAADVNLTDNLTASDVTEIRKLILGINTEFTKVQSWTFVPKAYVFPNPNVPYNAPREVLVPMLLPGTHTEDFVAIKMGDVTGNAIAHNFNGFTTRHDKQLHFEVEEAVLEAGKTYEIAFRGSNFADVIGYQFTLNFDQSALIYDGFKAGALEMDETNFGLKFIEQGKMTTSWNNRIALSFDADEVLFTLRFVAMKDAKVSELFAVTSDITFAEAYNESLETSGVDLGVRSDNGVVEGGVFELYQNTPNPFADETVISFRLPNASPAVLTVYDVAGKVIRVYEIQGTKGMNTLRIGKDDLDVSGMLYYQLDAADHSATKRMTKLK